MLNLSDTYMAEQSIIQKLQQQILSYDQKRPVSNENVSLGLGLIEECFSGKIFPKSAVHEFISHSPESASSTNGFIAVLLSKLMVQSGPCLWIGPVRNIYPPALTAYGVDPEKILFLETWKLKDRLWAIEEALKCNALSVVIGEVSELSFNDSRRLQLAVEKSQVTGFIHRLSPKGENAVACVTRWTITPLPSFSSDGLPGPGFPRWQVELLKLRNGKPGKWLVEFSEGNFKYINEAASSGKQLLRKIA